MAGPTSAEQSPGEQFRELHQRFFVMANAWDGASARLLAGAGFDALATSSAALAWSLGKRDGAVTRREAIENAVLIGRLTGLPVNGDFESGYGITPTEVAETITCAIEAGVAGCSIEDLERDGPAPLYSLDEALLRLEAARDAIARSGQDFVLTGRCEAYLAGVEAPRQEAVRRLAAYAEFADVLYAPGLTEADEVAEIVALSDRPVNVIAGLGGVSNDLAALEALGVKRISLGSGLAKVAFGSLAGAAQTLRKGRVDLRGAITSRVMDATMGDDDAG